MAAARARVDFRRLRMAPERIALGAGMAVTLNGIAQGYITDRVATLVACARLVARLRRHGRNAGARPPAGKGGLVGRYRGAAGLDRAPVRIAVADGAVATSAGYATAFEPTRRAHHLFSPRTGRSAGSFVSLTVTAPRATQADALSTALYVLPAERIPSILGRFRSVAAYVTEPSGEVGRISVA